jgi:hypothetical protein
MACLALGLLQGCTKPQTIQVDAPNGFLDIRGSHVNPLAANKFVAATVFIFTTADCPIANGYAPEIKSIISEYSARGVGFFLVHVDADLSVEDARKHAAEFGYACPVLLDPSHTLVAAVGASVTPEAAVVTRDRILTYRGRIDDLYADFGKKRMEPSHHDLRDALEAIVSGRPVPQPRTKAVGCFIADAAPR